MSPTATADDSGLSLADLRAIAAVVYKKSGITLRDGKQAFVIARLQRRLRALGVESFREYLRLIERDGTGDELVHLIDAIATNHTGFFREPQHFDLLRLQIVPEWRAGHRAGPFAVWCFPCSTGEEAVTIGITLLEAFPAGERDRARVLASDLSTTALKVAQQGVYPVARLAGIPPAVQRAYFERGVDGPDGLASVSAGLLRHITYQRANLLEIADLGRRFQAIFCRNVMIYFDLAARQRAVSMLERHLVPGGWLFIAHSESLTGITHSLRRIAPAVFRKDGA